MIEERVDEGTPAGGQRERIVHATGKLFRDKGYYGASMADIGRAVGLEKGSLYSHITAKHEVLRELAERGAALFLDGVAPIAASGDPTPLRLRAALRVHLRVVAHDSDLATVFLQEWRHLDEDARCGIVRSRDRYELLWRDMVRDGVRDGAFGADTDVEAAVLLFLSAGNWAYQWFDPSGTLTPDEVADRFSALILRGLGQRDGDE